MKTTTSVLTIIMTLLLISCGQANKKKASIVKHEDTAKLFVNKNVQKGLEERTQFDKQEQIDSEEDDGILREALNIAERYRAHNRFKRNYVATMPDSLHHADVYISSDFYFSNAFPCLIIRRTTPNNVYIDIFSKTGKQFHKVLSHKQWKLEYIGDTIRDINGDGLKDFVVNWYGVNGCCLKAFSNVYLLRSDKKSFSNSFEFINPTFSPREKIIRGVCYGHPGQTEMYKYKWNKEAVDTVEYIYYAKNSQDGKTGKLIVSNNLPYSPNHKVVRRLNHPPIEYRKIEGYNWFVGDLDGDDRHQQ